MDKDKLIRLLEKATNRKIDLIITSNKTIFISFRKPSTDKVIVRVHEIFLSAPSKVIKAISQFIIKPRHKNRSIIRDYINSNKEKFLKKQPERKRNINLIYKGRNYNLKKIFCKINDEYFKNKISCNVTWGRNHYSKRRNSIRFGCYNENNDLIVVNRVLDNDFIPPYFIEYIMYHEMLHACFFNHKPKTIINSKRQQLEFQFNSLRQNKKSSRKIHSRDFKSWEKQFKEYSYAKKWQKENLKKMLRT